MPPQDSGFFGGAVSYLPFCSGSDASSFCPKYKESRRPFKCRADRGGKGLALCESCYFASLQYSISICPGGCICTHPESREAIVLQSSILCQIIASGLSGKIRKKEKQVGERIKISTVIWLAFKLMFFSLKTNYCAVWTDRTWVYMLHVLNLKKSWTAQAIKHSTSQYAAHHKPFLWQGLNFGQQNILLGVDRSYWNQMIVTYECIQAVTDQLAL